MKWPATFVDGQTLPYLVICPYDCTVRVYFFTQTDPLPLAETHSEGEWLEQTAQQAQRLFGFVKGGAGHLIKNIKDTSSKMMQTVQTVAG